jgi:hypothetical protein
VRVEVQGDGDDVEVAGALAVAEERALDAIRTGEQGQLGGGDAGAAVVVRVQRDERAVAAGEVGAHPLDLVGVDVGRGVFDRGGQIEDDLVLDGRLPDVGDRLTDLQGKLELRAGEAFGRIFEAQRVPAAISGWACRFTHAVPWVAIGMMSARVALNTYFRWAGEVEL